MYSCAPATSLARQSRTSGEEQLTRDDQALVVFIFGRFTTHLYTNTLIATAADIVVHSVCPPPTSHPKVVTVRYYAVIIVILVILLHSGEV